MLEYNSSTKTTEFSLANNVFCRNAIDSCLFCLALGEKGRNYETVITFNMNYVNLAGVLKEESCDKWNLCLYDIMRLIMIMRPPYQLFTPLLFAGMFGRLMEEG